MINSQKRCKSLSEWIESMKYQRKLSDLLGSKYTEDKIQAMKMCSTVPKPDTMFSSHNSGASTDAGQGEFEIDEEI